MTTTEYIAELRKALKMWDDWAKNADLMDELNCDFALSVMRNGVHKEKLDATRAALALTVPGEKVDVDYCESCCGSGLVTARLPCGCCSSSEVCRLCNGTGVKP